VLLRDVRRVRRQRLVVRVVDEQLEAQALGILEDERLVGQVAADPLLPERERLVRADAEGDRVHHPVAGAPLGHPGYSKKVMSAPASPCSSA
jgi:hypothetical protein